MNPATEVLKLSIRNKDKGFLFVTGATDTEQIDNFLSGLNSGWAETHYHFKSAIPNPGFITRIYTFFKSL